MKQTSMLLAGFILSIPMHVVADDGQGITLEHPYIQISAGGAIVEDDNYMTLKLSGGVDLNKLFGVEAGYVGLTDIFFADADILYLSLVAKYPIGEKATLAGKLGISRWDSELLPFSLQTGNDHGVNPMIGFDLKYDLFKKVAIVISLEYYGSMDVGKSSGDETIIPGTIGVRYSF